MKAVNMAHDTKTTRASPPGIHPKSACVRFTSRFGVLLSARIYPANVNSGIAIKVEVFARRSISIIIADRSVFMERKLKIAIADITAKRGVLKSANKMKKRSRKKFSICHLENIFNKDEFYDVKQKP